MGLFMDWKLQTELDYYHHNLNVGVASRVAERLKKLRFHRFKISQRTYDLGSLEIKKF